MSKTANFTLQEIKSGYFIAWNVATQCAYTYDIVLKSGNTEIFHASKTNHSTGFQMIEQGHADFTGSQDLILTVTCNEASKELKSSIPSGSITDPSAKTVGYVYDICIEDSGDMDFNDVYINLVGWKSKG